MKKFKTYLNLFEKLDPNDDVEVWIKDFQKSNAPQFDGKSKDKRREMAIAAWKAAQEESIEEVYKYSQLTKYEGKTVKLKRDVEMQKVPTLKKGTPVKIEFIVSNTQIHISLKQQGKKIETYVRPEDLEL